MARAKPAAVAPTKSIGELIDDLELNRQARRKIEETLKPLEDSYKDIKADIIKMLDATHQHGGDSKIASVSISEVTVPKVLDVELLIKHIVKTKAYHLLLAQPMTTPSWREAVERNKGLDLPGTETFVKRDLNHSSIK